jgi:anaerobic magnesium-protoporphyrin IX monomethyl ester cyclase
MRVVLINPPCLSKAEKHWAGYLNLGLGYIAASLLASGREVTIVDAKLEDLNLEETVNRAVADSPDLIGITAMTVEFPQVVAISERIKSRWHAPIIIGGAHCKAVGSSTLQECRAIDYCCFGEGERLLIELIQCLEIKGHCGEINGLIYRHNSEVITNRSRPYLDNYDCLPFPAWHLFPKTSQIPLLTHRGCPFHCIFCSHNSGYEPRYRSVENTLSELEHIIGCYNPTLVRFEDETFGLHLKRTKEIMSGIIKRGFHLRTHFHAQTRVDCIDDEFMHLLKVAKFEFLELGVESGNDDVLKRIRKGISLAQVEVAVAMARRYEVKVWCNFILGHPHETRENMSDTVRFISHLNPDRLSVSIMTPYPGTPIYEMARKGKGGYRLLADDWKSFDKYSGAILEFGNVTLTRLKWLQIWCFIRLYLSNWRLYDLLRLALKQHILMVRMVRGLLQQVLSDFICRIRKLGG